MNAFAFAAALLAQPITVIDGDTVEAGGLRYRLAGVDAPELHGRCPAERALARRAKADLEALLAGAAIGAETLAAQPATAHYRARVVARLTVNGEDLAAALIARGAVRPDGSRAGWCETIRDPKG